MKLLLILFIAFMVLLSYSLCVASSTADKDAHEAYERWKERQKRHGKTDTL